MIWENIILALREIRRNVLRSVLTILGIVIGVAAVITMVTLGSGATEKVTADIAKLGSNMLHVKPGQDRRGSGGVSSSKELFDIEDARAIEREVFGLRAVAPTASKPIQAIIGNENWSTSVMGVDNEFLKVKEWSLESGSLFSNGDLKAGKAVCFIGTTAAKALLGNENPVGKRLRLGKISFTIIGRLQSKGQSSFGQDQDDIVLIPLRTFQRRIAGNQDVSAIYVSANEGVSTETVKADIEQVMRERRRISAGEDDNFYVRDMAEVISTLTGTTKVLTALLGAVAAVSLLVGGIGIMNIMLVSVTERTREIGTRLAIGAMERDVLMQFLIEAVVLSCFGGICGIGLGLSSAAAGARILEVPFVFQLDITALAFGFSALVGIVFGLFPARKAAQMDPIEALRHE